MFNVILLLRNCTFRCVTYFLSIHFLLSVFISICYDVKFHRGSLIVVKGFMSHKVLCFLEGKSWNEKVSFPDTPRRP